MVAFQSLPLSLSTRQSPVSPRHPSLSWRRLSTAPRLPPHLTQPFCLQASRSRLPGNSVIDLGDFHYKSPQPWPAFPYTQILRPQLILSSFTLVTPLSVFLQGKIADHPLFLTPPLPPPPANTAVGIGPQGTLTLDRSDIVLELTSTIKCCMGQNKPALSLLGHTWKWIWSGGFEDLGVTEGAGRVATHNEGSLGTQTWGCSDWRRPE